MNNEDIKVYNFLKKTKIVTGLKFFVTLKNHGIKGVKRKFKERKLKREKKDIKRVYFEENEERVNLRKIIDYQYKNAMIDVIIDNKLDCAHIREELSSLGFGLNIVLLAKKRNKEKKTIIYKDLKRLFSDRSFIWITNSNRKLDDFYYCKLIAYDENFKDNIKNLFNNIENVKLLANYNNINCVSVKAGTFFNFEGSNYYSGGAERYLIDMYEIFKKRNINLDIYQNAEKPFIRKYNGINVIGMSLKNEPFDLGSYRFMDKQTRHYANLTYGLSQLHIYSSFFEAYPNCISPSIGISHGIGWDNEGNKDHDAISFWGSKEMIIESAKQCDALVSVDTNTANWFQTIDYEIGNQKFTVIPNYVDIEEFSPRKDYLKERDKIVIVYPRRLYKPRGVYIALEAAEKLMKKYDNIEFHFVGKGFKTETSKIDEVCKKYPDRVFRYSKSPFEMYEVYKNADISLIPTLYSEGTSLSCLEAMASGNLVISTRIGGLSDLIINGYNGYLIEPNSEALFDTLDNVIKNYSQQILIKEKAVEVAKAFNKKDWIKKWEKEIDKFNLTEESKNIDLVEFYVKDIQKIDRKTLELIKKHIIDKDLVYIRSEKALKKDNITGGLIQIIDFEDEVVNKAKQVYVEKSLKNKVEREEKITLL